MSSPSHAISSASAVAAATTKKKIIKVSSNQNSDDSCSDDNENHDNNKISEPVLTEPCDDDDIKVLTETDMNFYDDMFKPIDEYGITCELSPKSNKKDCDEVDADDANGQDTVDATQNSEQLRGNKGINFKLKLDLNLSADDSGGDDLIVLKNRKKFLESDDTIINQIFSQTITSSTGVTPTDEYENFAFENLNSDIGGSGGGINFDISSSNHENTGILTNLYNSKTNSNQPSTATSLTENIDHYNEDDNSSILLLNIADDTTTVATIPKEEEEVINKKIGGIKSRPSIFVDCYDDADDLNEPCYVEPITPKQIKSYFDEESLSHVSTETKDEQNDSYASNNINYNEIIDNEIELTDIEIYKSISNDNQSLHQNGDLIDINEQVCIKNDTDTDDDTNGTTTDDVEQAEPNDECVATTAIDDNNEYTNTQIKTNIYDKLHLLYEADFGSNLLSNQSAISEQQQHHVEQSSTTAMEQKSLTKTKKIITTTTTSSAVTTKEMHEIKSTSTNGVAESHKIVGNDVGGTSGAKKAIKSIKTKTATGNNTDILIQSNKQQSTTTSTAEDVNNHHHNQIYDESTTTDNVDDEVQVKKSKKKKKSKVADDSNTEPGGTAVKEKRKKSKKSKKSSDPEKENISVKPILESLSDCNNKIMECVTESTHNGPTASYYEGSLLNIDVKSLKKNYLLDSQTLEKKIHKENLIIINKDVSVKHLCRSFGDLTTLCEAECLPKEVTRTNFYLKRAKSIADLRKFEPIHTGVSVKALRDSYCNLVGLTDTQLSNSNNNCNFGLSKKIKSDRVGFGIKKLDMRSSFSKFDALQKKNILHVRSTDPAKAQEKFNGMTEQDNDCRSCGKVVFQMEQIKAEKSIWHKNCFRCSVDDCNKQLNVDTYQSHDGILFCKPHFKALFTPKAVEDNEPAAASNDEAEELEFDVKPRKHELIIRENQPVELPPDVVRSSDKPDLGLDELQSLNVKERFQMFENSNTTQAGETGGTANDRSVKRSTSILSKLAKFQAKGMNIGEDSLNGVPLEQSDDENEENEEESEEDDEANGDVDLIRSKKIKREKPMSFASMNEMKTKFEHGHSMTKEERREERKQEIQNIRSRLFMGKQARIKEMYQQAVADSEQGIVSANRKPDIEIGDKAKSIKERFEKGEAFVKKNDEEDDEQRPSSRINGDDQAVFEQGISKKSRSIFLEMDATAAKSGPITPSPLTPTPRTPDAKYRSIQQSFNVSADDVVKCEDKVDDIKIETSELSSKFKFFETYRPEDKKKKEFRITPPRDGVVKDVSPDREIYRDPDVIRGDDPSLDDPVIAEKSQTAKKMLSIFRQLEEKEAQKPQYEGLKPLKRFTPPPDEGRRMYKNESESDYTDSESEDDDDEEESEDEESETEPNPSYVKSTDKFEDEFLKQAQSAERAKQLRAKFEKWESQELKREKNSSAVNLYDQNNEESQVESAKSIRAKFETMRDSSDMKEKRDRIKVNRFV